MSLLAEILATADLVEMDDLKVNFTEVSDKISSLKQEIMETMENSYIQFLPYVEWKENNDLLTRATTLCDNVRDLEMRIENQIKRELSDSTGELQNLKHNLQVTDLSLSIAKRLASIHQCLVDANSEQNAHHFSAAALKLDEMENLLKNAEDELVSLDIHGALEEELVKTSSDFLYSVLEKWKPCISWNEIITDSNKKNKEITLSIVDDDLKSDLITALHYYDLLIIEINKFGDKLLKNILISVIDQTTRVIVTREDTHSTLLVQTKNSIDYSCVNVINNLVVVFNFLFLQFDIDIGESSFIAELGERICNGFIQHFIRNCLDKAVPKCQENLNSYEQVVKQLLQLEELLHTRGFLPIDDKQLSEYSQNADVLITKKICDTYLESARKLMKCDLHDMMLVGPFQGNSDMNDTTTHGQDGKAVRKVKSYHPLDSDQHVYVSEISINTYQFPICQISKSAAELIDLVKVLLNEATKSKTKNCAVQLFSMARNIFKLYCDIVPLHHKKMIETLPQQAALLNNNCCFLSHNLLIMGITFKEKLPPVLQGNIITFVDLVDSLRSVGNEVLSKQIDLQNKQILDILRDSGLVTVTECSTFPAEIEKAIRQCVRQLLLLQKVWSNVMPSNTYCESIGTLSYTFVQELVDRVCSFGDIPAHTASELVRVFTIVLEKIPAVFSGPIEIFEFVKNWTKFNELVRLLGARLQDVEERWSDGKGPLALEFTADQVKKLVKALFQISEKRADLLARIK